MDITTTTARRISITAWVMAAFGTVAGELHALARINSHPGDLESPLTRAWAVPAMDAIRPLLDWGDPYYVYWTYGKIWAPICLAFFAAAFLVYTRRRPAGLEKRAWQVQLAAYALLTISVVGDYFTPWTDQFFIVGVVALLAIGLRGTGARHLPAAARVPPAAHRVGADRLPAVLHGDHHGHFHGQRATAADVGLGDGRAPCRTPGGTLARSCLRGGPLAPPQPT